MITSNYSSLIQSSNNISYKSSYFKAYTIRSVYLFLIPFFVLFISCSQSEISLSPARIGVVENQYDHIENTLKRYHINHKMIKYRDIENKSLYSSFDAIFFPCGAEPPLTSSVNILSRGSHLEGVSLKDQYYKVDTVKSGLFLKDFISNGGSAYFSDFSYRYLQDSINVFTFYKNFPYIGRASQLKSNVSGELKSYIGASSLSLYIGHEGWVIPENIRHGEVLLSAQTETPLGLKNAPLSTLIKYKSGQVLFTSYHNENDNTGIVRYLIMRTIYKREVDALTKFAEKWEQTVQSQIADKSLAGETARIYSMKAVSGRNDLYFRSDGGEWQIDILDSEGLLLYSYDGIGNDFRYDFTLSRDQNLKIKIIPLSLNKFNAYNAVIASGFRVMPYYLHIIVTFIGLVLIAIYIRYLRIERFRGKVHSSGSM